PLSSRDESYRSPLPSRCKWSSMVGVLHRAPDPARHYFDVGKSPLPAAYRTIADQDPRNADDGGLKLYRLAGNRHRRVAHHRSAALNSPHEPTTNASITS